ncbi:hypothetical protein MMC08_008714, partial [Hypocenomyce scalaris]|nr:hypothetical protein [Hypocenomyce scalaris]
DLKEQASPAEGKLLRRVGLPPSGFAGLSRRVGKKPVIAAVNGFAVGGGFEICLNCDIVVASPTAEFGLPEALRGLYAGAGGLARLTRNCGLQVASELVLTGRRISATEAKQLNLINRISKSQGSLIDEAIALAQTIDQSSPDSVIVSRAGIREAWETGSVDRAGQLIVERFQARLLSSENRTIGLKAFAQKQKPKWVPSKL